MSGDVCANARMGLVLLREVGEAPPPLSSAALFTRAPCVRLCSSRCAVVAVLLRVSERPRGGDQGLRRGPANEGAAEEGTAGPGRQGRRRQQSGPQQWPLRQGKARLHKPARGAGERRHPSNRIRKHKKINLFSTFLTSTSNKVEYRASPPAVTPPPPR